jgi:hypothetical protein
MKIDFRCTEWPAIDNRLQCIPPTTPHHLPTEGA